MGIYWNRSVRQHWSLPSRERGLKFVEYCRKLIFFCVAPFAGAWIEINHTSQYMLYDGVAPFAGAWIEINEPFFVALSAVVAPFAGAWIEISKCYHNCQPLRSLPSRERGLKSVTQTQTNTPELCRSLRGSVD